MKQEEKMETNLVELRSYLHKELENKTNLNPQYSKRAYSRDLGISTTSLNDFLSGKRSLSFENIDKVFKYLSKKSTLCCSWCDKPKKEVKALIGGPRRQFICVKCVETCNEILKTDRKMPKNG
jgi:hypothetical protein